MYNLALTDNYGNLFAEPEHLALGRLGRDLIDIEKEGLIPLPEGSTVAMLVGRSATAKRILGSKKKGSRYKTVTFSHLENERVYPAGAILPPGYTRTCLPAYELTDEKAPMLPFFAYTAMGIKGEEACCSALQTHKDLRWDPGMYNSLELPQRIAQIKKDLPGNRLLDHLENCSLVYRCFTAQNIFYRRWEGGIPTSSACNAGCIGCISESHAHGVSSPQDRISFVPTDDEIADLSVYHLQNPGAIISFGQGCEGEPLTRADLIKSAIIKTRQKTDLGTINMNTNGSLPDKLEELLNAGLDAVRISLNSAIEKNYLSYFRPSSFAFADVVKSVNKAFHSGAAVSLNYLYMPGISDRESEAEAFINFLENNPVHMIQVRNLNIDADYYIRRMGVPPGKALGTENFLRIIKNRFPKLLIGNFSIPKDEMLNPSRSDSHTWNPET